MAITTVDGLVAALADPSTCQFLYLNKHTALTSMVAGTAVSTWRMLGIPAQPAIPGAAEICHNTTGGTLAFSAATEGRANYIAQAGLYTTVASSDIQIHDRLAHMGGLSGTSTGVQTVNLDVSGVANNLATRRGAADYSDVQWWLEWYTNTGSSTPTITVTYTNAAGQSGRTFVTSALPATVAAGRMYLIGPTANGEFIRSIQSVQLSGTTGAVGNWGVTATRSLGGLSMVSAFHMVVSDWQQLGFPKFDEKTCLFPIIWPTTTSSGQLMGYLKIAQG